VSDKNKRLRQSVKGSLRKRDERQKRLKDRGFKLKQPLKRLKWSVKLQKLNDFVSNRKRKPQLPLLKLKESGLNKRKQLLRLNVLALHKKPNKSVWQKLKLLRLPLSLRLKECVGKKQNARRGRKKKNSSTKRKSWRRRLRNWQHLLKLKHL